MQTAINIVCVFQQHLINYNYILYTNITQAITKQYSFFLELSSFNFTKELRKVKLTSLVSKFSVLPKLLKRNVSVYLKL